MDKQFLRANDAVPILEKIKAVQTSLEQATADRVFIQNQPHTMLEIVGVDDRREFLEGRLVKLQQQLSEITGRRREKENPQVVSIGDRIVLSQLGGSTMALRVSDEILMDPNERCISTTSPLGKEVIGRALGEEFMVTNLKGHRRSYQIVGINDLMFN
jgi:transcription elongation GreA/GreB family factor